MRSSLSVFVFATLCATASGQILPEDPPLILPEMTVDATNDDQYDPTGMGSVEEQMRDEPFSNDLIQIADFAEESELTMEMNTELASVATPSPAERIASDARLSLRGFPTPQLRNGFIRVGLAEVLNTQRTIIIQGPLVPVLGRAAPGGIQDLHTARPRAKVQRRLDLQATSDDRQRVFFESTGPLVPKKAWHRVAFDWQRREGPQEFARHESVNLNAAVTWRHSRKASTLLSADFRDIDARAAPGIPEYRPEGGGLIVGPYRPLAYFNANGPDGGVKRRSATFAVQFDGMPLPQLALRANAEAWWRNIEQERFTTSVLSLDTGLFEGVREPRHIEQPERAVAAQLEVTGRFRAFKAHHKLLASVSHTWGSYAREDRGLSIADRNALPLSVRRFNPFSPDYFRPAYDPAVFTRIFTDREDTTRYTAFEVSDRMAFARGRWVASAGLRFDSVDLTVNDRRVNAVWPEVTENTSQLSYHAGLNWQVRPSQLLAYASASTAFDPSTRVDARTGRVQGNETTRGFEAGMKGRVKKVGLDFNLGAFLLYNEDIARRNPLYDDPIADANQTQPQLVSAGEERYTGGRLDVRWQVARPLSVMLRSVYVRAITTASPDIPQEVGRPLARLPDFTNTAQVRYRSVAKTGGWFSSATWQYIGGYVAHYEDARRAFLEYPGYGLVHGNVGYAWRAKKRTVEVDLGVRNALDRDLIASHARVGADRAVTLTTRVYF